jgi:hypothetical protein
MVSGLVRDGRWDDAAGLEAARLLLLTRFDLKVGLWDLATNPILRAAALDTIPTRVVPPDLMDAPPQARRRAAKGAADALTRKLTAKRAVTIVVAALQPGLAAAGWNVDEGDTESLVRPLTRSFAYWPGSKSCPLVYLRLDVMKTATRVVACHCMPTEIDITTFVNERRGAFEAVAPLPSRSMERVYPNSLHLWKSDSGWGDPHSDWQSTARIIAKNTRPWVALLADLVVACRKIHLAKFGRDDTSDR